MRIDGVGAEDVGSERSDAMNIKEMQVQEENESTHGDRQLHKKTLVIIHVSK